MTRAAEPPRMSVPVATLRAGAEGIVPSAPGHPAVMVAYSAELAEAVVRVRARSEQGARLRAEGLCSGLDWVAGAKPEITPV